MNHRSPVLTGLLFAVSLFIPHAARAATSPVAQATPAPTASPAAGSSADRFTFLGKVRAFDFTRQNASAYAQGGANKATNQQTFNIGVSLHGDYALDKQWTAGASYFYANPFNCTVPVSHYSPPCGKNPPPALNPDDTIPGFTLSTLYEAYLKFQNSSFYGKVGNQTYTTPWANPADTRIKPAAFQGADVVYTIDPQWQVQASDMIRYEPRTSSNFDQVTLITGYPAGNAGPPANIYVPNGGFLANSGFFYGRVGYTSPQKGTANAQYYAFNNIANFLWLDARFPFAGKMKPFLAAQFGVEKSTGTELVGKIDSTVTGLQAGATVIRNVTFTLGFDTIPLKTDTIVLPKPYTCKNNTISGTAAGGVTLPYFLPTSGTSNCSPAAGGKTNIYYGGIASPYTDGYTADPLYTTSLTQGMVERRSPGTSWKAILNYTTLDRRLVAYISRAWYDYNNPGYAQGTYENDFDVTYYFRKLPKAGQYKGLFFRYRYGERDQSGNANIGGTPLFKNNRFQAEFDF